MEIKKNWKLNDTVMPEDLNRIEGNIEELQAGLSEEDFTAEEKEKLASVEYGATAVSVENSLTSDSATAALSAKQGKVLKEVIEEEKATRIQTVTQIKNKITELEKHNKYKIMTVKIDLNNSNPATCCSYHDDATNMIPGSSEWDEFFGHYPCVLKDGKEVGLIDKNNYNTFIDGNLYSRAHGNLMVGFPRRGLTIYTSEHSVFISMTNNPNNPRFQYYAHQRGDYEREIFYVGAYKGFIADRNPPGLESAPHATPTGKYKLSLYRDYAEKNGPGYGLFAFYQYMYCQAMYLLKYKNLNSQVALGRGYVDGNSAVTITGGTNTRGMDFGETTGKVQMKLFGLEDFWGNGAEWIDGILIIPQGRKILTTTRKPNNTGEGYKHVGTAWDSNDGGWMSGIQGNSELGFILKNRNASNTTFFCDYSVLNGRNSKITGLLKNTSINSGNYSGIFSLYFGADLESTSGDRGFYGCRLMYL